MRKATNILLLFFLLLFALVGVAIVVAARAADLEIPPRTSGMAASKREPAPRYDPNFLPRPVIMIIGKDSLPKEKE